MASVDSIEATEKVRVNHIVMVKFGPQTTDENISTGVGLLLRVKEQMEGFESMTHGPYKSNEGLNKGYNYGFTMVFSNEKARDEYLVHPAHEVAKSYIFAFAEDAIAFDYLIV
jgi:hypothetical protein